VPRKKPEQELSLTNLDKVFWDEEGYTKGDVIAYYNMIAETILPYFKDRPMVLNRHPNGIKGKSFFQKQVNMAQTPSWIKTVPVQHSHKTVHYMLVQDKDTLSYVANLGCIELNPFHSRVPSLDNPDYLIFDLDPEDVPFKKVVDVALFIHEILEDIGIKNFCKTSGSRGLHIYVPLRARYTYKQANEFVNVIAHVAVDALPDLISLERSPKKRQGQIYIDVPRNIRGQTLAAPYCLRPKPHAPVSTPLAWKEVKGSLDPLDFNIETVPKRIKKVGDLFKAVLGPGVDLHKGLRLLEKMLGA